MGVTVGGDNLAALCLPARLIQHAIFVFNAKTTKNGMAQWVNKYAPTVTLGLQRYLGVNDEPEFPKTYYIVQYRRCNDDQLRDFGSFWKKSNLAGKTNTGIANSMTARSIKLKAANRTLIDDCISLCLNIINEMKLLAKPRIHNRIMAMEVINALVS
uniref:Uncharacterized protein n=1 Tax=Romanomermis culicivorax TaxID=13658 RepID=A0A915JRB9_ROMCU